MHTFTVHTQYTNVYANNRVCLFYTDTIVNVFFYDAMLLSHPQILTACFFFFLFYTNLIGFEDLFEYRTECLSAQMYESTYAHCTYIFTLGLRIYIFVETEKMGERPATEHLFHPGIVSGSPF